MLENGSNPKPKVLQSLGQNSKMISSLGPESQIGLLHNSISFIGKEWNSPQEIAPPILTHFNFQYFCTALGTLRGISTTMAQKESQESMHPSAIITYNKGRCGRFHEAFFIM